MLGLISRISSQDRMLLARAAQWGQLRSIDDIVPEALLQVARTEGIDFATALAYDRICRAHAHSLAITQLNTLDPALANSVGAAEGTLVLVPGAFHQERARQTGADGRVVREEAERLGFTVAIAPTLSFGSLEQNSDIVRQWLAQSFAEPVVLVSLSKGTAEVKMALRAADAAHTFRQVTSWVSLSGIWWGSPLVGWLLARPVRRWFVRQMLWWRGHDFRVIEQLGYGPDQPLAFTAEPPEHVHMLHVVGFPLMHTLCNRMARRGHRRLSLWGPNDAAGMLLADAARLPGTVYPVWGADHYLRSTYEDNRLLMRRILLWLNRHRSVNNLLPAEAEL